MVRSVRELNIYEEVARAETDLREYKNAQIFGKDVTKPKIIQRLNLDGSPTEWDLEGTSVDTFGFIQYRVAGMVTYQAYNQESPWATIYAKIRVNPTDQIHSTDVLNFSAYPNMDDVFMGNRIIRFNVNGTADGMSGGPTTRDPTIDRLWVKFYVLATDYGTIKLDFPYGTNGAGQVIQIQ